MEIRLRRANLKDMEFIFRLRNEEAVRKVSFSSNSIDSETHQKWFEKKLMSDDCVLFVAEGGSRPIAQVRFDLLGSEEAEVNIAVTKEFRGRGYGSEILKKSSLRFFEEFPEYGKIYAYIKPDNVASVRSFGKAGYGLIGEVVYKGQVCVEMILTR